MRVVHVVVAGEIGGAERMLVDLARAKGGTSHTIALMTPNPKLRELFRDEGLVIDDRGPVREGPLAHLVCSLGRRDVGWLADVVAQRRADIVHLHTFGSQVVGTRAALRCGVRIVRTEHSSRVYDDPTCWPFSRWSLQRADAAVCISAHVRDVALTRAPWAAPKLRVVANGVDVERFAPTSMPRGAPVRFIAVGRLEPRKGFDIALAALAQVSNAELDIVGDGQDRAALERLAARLGVARRVRFLGYQEDVRGALADAHLAVSSARAEGLGIALLEAMATRRAVVALPTGGIPEIVRDGETGWLARGNDAPALARVMREAMGQPDEIQRRSERARALVVEHYSVASMREGYDAVYQSA